MGDVHVNTGIVLWEAARAAALAAFAVLSASLLTGMALRTALLAPVARNKAVLALHSFLSWFWVPLVAVHVTAIILDGTSRLSAVDAVLPFRAPYAQVPIGLGTVGLLLLVLVGVTSALRRRMSVRVWRWVHRLSYPMFGVFLVHAQLAGSDFSRTWISLLGWATVGALLMLAVARAISVRAPRRPHAQAAPGG
jgi:DMSO/TMAO reductase YedYZ heme-binding membrane subunit